MALDVSMILRLVDRLSGPAKRAQASVKSLTGGLAAADREGTKASRGLGRAEAAATRMGNRMALAKAKVEGLALKALPTLNRAAERTGRGLGMLIKGAGGLALAAAQWGAVGAGAGAGFLLGGVVSKSSQLEQFQVMLENTEGSAEKARAAMQWVREFAKKTPYELEQVMQAFVSLKAYGIDPMDGSLKSLGNAASGMSKDLMQAIEMMADAQTGEFERLKEFGVRAKVQGDKVTFTYMKAGREISRSAKNSAADIKRELTGIFDERFGGMMDRQSKTLLGMWSNIKDMVAGFQLDVGNAGFFDKIKGKVEGLLTRLNKLAADGTLERWAERISHFLERMVDHAARFINETDWDKVKADASALLGLLQQAASALAWMARNAETLSRLNPAGNAINFGKGLYNRFEQAQAAVRGAFTAPAATAGRPANAGPRRVRPLIDPNRPHLGRQSDLPRPAVGKQSMAIDNRLQVAISAPPGLQARVTGQQTAPGTRLTVKRDVKRGLAMAGAA